MIAVYRCDICSNISMRLQGGGPSLTCCGEKMDKLIANTTEAAREKHLPDCSLEDGQLTIQVGKVPHPMTNEHSIQWLLIEQDGNLRFLQLPPGGEPRFVFPALADEPYTVYEYCNLHGLWKSVGK